MRKVSELLLGSVERSELLQTARAQKTLRKWKEVVGPLLEQNTLPERFRKGTLWVIVKGSAWAQEVSMQRENILQRLNKIACEDNLFVEIKITIFKKKREDLGL